MTRRRVSFLGLKSRKPTLIAGILLLVLIPAALLAARHPSKVKAQWFDTSWGYRTQFIVSNSSGSTQTNFQVQVATDTATLVTAGKMLSNCNDLRFTDNNGLILNYWIEPGTCNTTNTLIWINVQSIPTTGASIYMYYGNPNAQAASSDTNTFVRVVPNLTGAWNMDESSWTNDCSTSTVLDSSGNNLSGKSCPAGTGPTGGATGQYGYAGTFNGSDSEVLVSDNDKLDGFTSMSIFFWAKPTVSQTSEMVIKHLNSTSDQNWELFQSGTSIVGRIVGTSNSCTSAGTFTTGTWHYIGMVWNGSQIQMYIDGVPSGNACNRSVTMTNSVGDLSIGRYKATSSNYPFAGSLDNMRLYNRALSANEITDIYGTAGSNQGYVTTNYPGKELVRKYNTGVTYTVSGTEENSLGPVLWLKMDEGSGSILKDSSGKNNNSNAISGSTKWATDDQCVSGKCLEFPSAAGAVAFTVPNSNSLNFGTNSFTVEGWGFFRDFTYPRNTFMLHKSGACYSTPNAANTGFDINTSYSASGFQVCLNDGTNRASGTLTFDVGFRPADIQNKWTHYAVVFDRTANKIKVYVNGIKQTNEFDTSAVTGSITNTSQAVIIGSSYGWQTDGRLDDIRIYPYARSATQVLSDYNSPGVLATNTQIGVQPTTYLNNGLVGYLKMDEATWSGTTNEVYDFSGKNASGTAQGPTNAKAYPTVGMFGGGGYFDGVDDSVGLNQLTTLPSTITVSAWIKPSSLSTSNGIIFGAVQGYNTFFGSITSTGELTYRTSSASTYSDLTTSGAGLQTGKWYQVVFTQDATSRKLYINGVQKASDTNILWTNAITNFSLGIRAAGSSFSTLPYNGIIDEFRIYNRALSANEVTQLYNWAPGPMTWWKMDEKTGTSVSDSSGSNLNSTSFTGSPAWTPGKYGSALSFGGTNQAVNFGNVGGITGNISVAAWVKWNQFKNYGVVVERGNGGTASSMNYAIWSYSNQISCFFGNGTQSNSASYATLPSIGVWHHVECVANGTNIILYLDGIAVTPGAQTITPSGTIAGTTLTVSEPSYTIDGSVDDVKIYNYARTPAQVLQDMNGDHPVGGSPVGSQLLYWRFDEGLGGTVHDSGPNNYTAVYSCASLTSCPTGTFSWTDGKINKGVYFNPTLNSDRPYFHRSPTNISSTVGTKMTWTLWLNPNTSQVGGGWLFRNGNGTDENYGVNVGAYSGGKYKVSFTGYDTGFKTVTSTNYLVPSSTWSHLAVVYSQGQWVKLYVNGVFQEQITWPYGATVQASTELDVGGNSGAYQNYNGYLDEFKIYNDELTADQIKIDMNANASLNFGSGSASESGLIVDGPGNPPVGYWTFDEKTGSTVNDKSGNGNPGTWGGTLGSQWTVGKYNAGGNFNGVDNVVNIPNPAANLLDVVSNDLTYSFWFKPFAATSYRLIQKGNPYNIGGAGYSLLWRGDMANKPYTIQLNDTTFNTGSCPGSFSINGITDLSGSWHHISWSISKSTNTTTIYVDGKYVGSVSIASCSQPFTSGSGVTIGNGGSLPVKGQIDEVKVYNYTRTPAQIAYDYNRGEPIAIWRMDECQGTAIHDSSGNGYDGTWGGGTSIGTCTTPSTAWGNGVNGKLNSSLNFSAASNDYVSIPAGITLGNDMTLSAWIKTSAATEKPILSDRTGTGRTYFGTNPSGKAMLYYNSASPASILSNKTVTDNVWHHIVYTRFGTTSTLYIDGIQDNQITQTGFVAQSTAIRIGHDVANVTEYFNGQIDDVRIYSYALSSSQVKTLFNDKSSVRYAPITGTP